MKELPKVYEPQQVESSIYEMWMENDCFKATPDPESKSPTRSSCRPPTSRDSPHGARADATLQDILTRLSACRATARSGSPGTDHAGIATPDQVEESCASMKARPGTTSAARSSSSASGHGRKIRQPHRRAAEKLGVSCDWSRSRFTMDEGCSKAVREAFCEMCEKGLIYKGSRIINWCPHCLTALSDAEVEYTDKPGHLWYIRYPLADGPGDIVVATTRPRDHDGRYRRRRQPRRTRSSST